MLRICINCPHWSYDQGDQGEYSFMSDESGGSQWSMTCAKDHFFITGEDTTQEELRDTLLKAQDCPDFEERKQ